MKKIVFVLVSFLLLTSFVSPIEESILRFENSPSYSDLEKITDEKNRFCEEIFLDAYRRRDFTEEENKICSDIFEQKIEDELNYMKAVFSARWIY